MKASGMSLVFAITVAVALLSVNTHLDAVTTRLAKRENVREALKDISVREPVKLVEVISGDTVVLIYRGRKQLVRLQGVDAPERNDPSSDEAVELLRGLLEGKSIELALGRPSRAKDDRGGLTAWLFADGESVNEQMREAGWRAPDADIEIQHPESLAEFDSDAPGEILKPSAGGQANLQKSPKTAVAPVPASVKVYITPHDKTYHRAGCRLLRNAGTVPVLKAEAIRLGYKRCRRCKP